MFEKIIKIPKNVKITNINNDYIFEGKRGTNYLKNVQHVQICINSENIQLFIQDKKKKSFLNLYYSIIINKIKGVSKGFKNVLYLKGIGYKASVEQKKLILKLGYSFDIKVNIPKNINILIHKSNMLILYGIDLEILHQFIFNLKKYRLPEPYKGKGILLKNEEILRKEGKKKK